jgi:membrane-associated phospholipid phosphatase
MRDDRADSVTPGGRPAPLGARGARTVDEARHASTVTGPGDTGARPRHEIPAQGGSPAAGPDRSQAPLDRIGGATGLLVALLAVSLLAYSLIAADVVHEGRLSELDSDVASWIAREMPTWAEWLARPFTWLGGMVGVAMVVSAATVWLLSRGARAEAALLVASWIGIQLLVVAAKNGYERPRPDFGSPIDVPPSFSFPSGHAANGIAVLGLLSLVVAAHVETTRAKRTAVVAGFALGALCGASRVVLNVHYVSDVAAGAFLGLAWLALCVLAARAIDRRLRDRAG